MCGIVGIVSFDPQATVDETRLKRMRDILYHRGPDGEGLWVDKSIGLGHRRLAIVDLAGGHQPMANEDQTVWIVFNGEIYNHAALRPGLEARGHHYRTRSDTETILHLYEEEGERCVEQLHGMFAFAIWDAHLGRLLLARDRLGIKPLYYACTDNELLFASEIKAILAAGGIRPAFNKTILPEFLANRFVAGEETFFRSVRKLLPGRTLSWSHNDGFRERRYWQVPVTNYNSIDLPDAVREVRVRLEAAVQSHLMSDVPLGLFLSGGIDSSGLAALMAPMVKEPIRTFAVGFADPSANELAYARMVAQQVGAEHHEVVVSPKEFFSILPTLLWHEDEPIAFPSSIPLYFVSRLAREHVKVVLTGEGADELFLGYNRYRVTAWNERLGRRYWGLLPGPCQRLVRRLIDGLPTAIRRDVRRTFLGLRPGYRELFYENFATFPTVLQQSLLSDKIVLSARDPYAEGLRCYDGASGGTLERMSTADLHTYLVELLMKQDQMSMAASIESRVPYLDDRFVEFAAALPGCLKLRGLRTKVVLREALKDVIPDTILTRKKMGFPVPVSKWLRGPFWPIVEEFVLGLRAASRGLFDPRLLSRLAEEHRVDAEEHGDRLWLLVNLEVWNRIFLDGEDRTTIMRSALARCGSSG